MYGIWFGALRDWLGSGSLSTYANQSRGTVFWTPLGPLYLPKVMSAVHLPGIGGSFGIGWTMWRYGDTEQSAPKNKNVLTEGGIGKRGAGGGRNRDRDPFHAHKPSLGPSHHARPPFRV